MSNILQQPDPKRQTLLLGTAVYTSLLVLAAVFYQERMAVLDMAFQTFQILRTGALQIQSGRFGAAATQVFPWLAQEAGLPLQGVLQTYSTGHILYYILLFLGITAGLGQWKWGLVLILCSTLLTSHTFYWLSEMPQGLAFLILVLAWVDRFDSVQDMSWWQMGILVGALVTAFYFHPLVIYPLLFSTAYIVVGRAPLRKKRIYLLLAGAFLVLTFLKYKVFKLDWYDAMSLERARAFGELWPNWIAIRSNRDFLHWCWTDYYMVPLLLLLNTGFYLWNRDWLKAILVSVSPFGFLLLVNVPFHAGDNQFYLENLYVPLAFFVALPLVVDVLPRLGAGRFIVPGVALIALIGVLRITHRHQSWTDRINWERTFLEKTAGLQSRKLLLTEEQVPMDTLILSWGSAYEFLLLSALESPDSARCILIDESAWRFDSLLEHPRLFLGEFQNYRYDQMPGRYFHLRDTTPYVRLEPFRN
ncbi:MAG: hypothetical protein EP344_06910 [Bacteroidetes bacterium]|nr:MAG: hypothetical protein EP344_06910 [Bacteroidota bacterium]